MKKLLSFATCFILMFGILSQTFLSFAATGASITLVASSRTMLAGQTITLTATTNPSGLNLTWTSSDTSVATVNTSGIVTGINEGKVYITVYCTYNGIETSSYVEITVNDSDGLEDGETYYIMNYSSGRYLSLETTSNANNVNVYTRSKGTLSIQKWTMDEMADHTMQLISYYSSTNRVLNVTGTNIDIYTDTDAATQKFDVYRVESGTYKGYYVIRYGDYYVTQNSSYNVYLTAKASALSYWSFMKVDKGDASVYGSSYIDSSEDKIFDTTIFFSEYESYLTSSGYDVYTETNPMADEVYTCMQRYDDISIIYTHGNAGVVCFYNDSGNETGALCVNSMLARRYGFPQENSRFIEDYSDNALASLRCVLYVGCLTGVDYVLGSNTYNLVDATYEKGAHFVLGTEYKILVSDATKWIEYFLESINEGSTIQEAISYADEGIQTITVFYNQDNYEYSLTYDGLPTYYVGDTSQYLK